MEHTSYTAFFESIAKSHREIKHDQPISGFVDPTRKSFFRMNNGMEMQQAIATDVHWPALLVAPYFGRVEAGSQMDDMMTASFEIRKDANPHDFEAIEEARSDCKRIGQEIIALLYRMMEDEGRAGPIPGFDLNTVTYDFTGPHGTGQYGCLFKFIFKNEFFNPYTFDKDAIFKLPI